jgi:hypothetical protein
MDKAIHEHLMTVLKKNHLKSDTQTERRLEMLWVNYALTEQIYCLYSASSDYISKIDYNYDLKL